MKKISGAVGFVCVVVGAVLLATGSAQPLAIGLLVVGLLGLVFTVGGSAGAGT